MAKVTCSICNKEIDYVFIRGAIKEGRIYTVAFCEGCKIGITVPQPSRTELINFYASGNYRIATGRRFRRVVELFINLFRVQRKNRIKKYAAKGRLLDVGCGRGLFLDIMNKDGWDVTGTEYDREVASNISSAYGISVLHGDLNCSGLPEATFDVITLNHVLEHISRPLETIRECRRLLKKGGLLVIAVPNIFSLQALAGKKAWFHLDLPYHLHHFSEEGLSNLIRNNSFRIIKTRRYDLEYNAFGWLQTFLNLSGIKENYLYNILKNPSLIKSELKSSNKVDLILTSILVPLYLPVSLLLSFFESLIKKGGTVEIYAFKE